MPAKTDADYLRDMLKYAEHPQQLVVGRELNDLETDLTFRFALQYCVLIIGEAASRVSDDMKQRIPAIPWRPIVGMRNWLVHGYSAIRDETLWDTTHDDLPNLVQEILKVIPPEQT